MNENEQGKERGLAYLYAYSVKKNWLNFQTANRIPSNKLLAVAKSFIKKAFY